MIKLKNYIKKYREVVNDNGFSLLELVVAVGILLVLTVGGLLAYNGLIRNARVAAVQSAASEVYTGAVAYDSNGQDFKQADDEWNGSSKKDKDGEASIVVNSMKNSAGEICSTAEMTAHDIAVNRGAGCASEGVVDPGDDNNPLDPGGNGGVIVNPGDDGDNEEPMSCFEVSGDTITDYREEQDECGSDVVIPQTLNNTTIKHIGDRAFSDSWITSVEFPDSLETIGDSAFESNELSSVSFPVGLKTIGNNAFYFNQLESVSFPVGLTTIGDSAFEENQIQGEIKFPTGLKTIGNSAFKANQLSFVSFPVGFTSIGNSAFENNELESASFPDSLETIGDSAFSNNHIREKFKFPAGLKTIGDSAFTHNALEIVRVSKNTTIAPNAFEDNGLEKVSIIQYD